MTSSRVLRLGRTFALSSAVLVLGLAGLALALAVGHVQLDAWDVDSEMSHAAADVRRRLSSAARSDAAALRRRELEGLLDDLARLQAAAGREDEAADRAVAEEARALSRIVGELLVEEATTTTRLEPLLRRAEALEQIVAGHSVEHRERAERWLHLALPIALTGLLPTVLLVALWERRRLRAEEALEASRRHLARVQRLESVGRLAGGIAHDINNHLAAIRAHCELVLELDPPREKVERTMGLVVKTVIKASALIERLLTFAGRQASRAEPVDLAELVDELASVLRSTLPSGATLETAVEEGLPPVVVDVTGIEQVIANLVVNARDAIAEGGRIVISADRRSAPGGRERIVLAVEDDGKGIPAEHLEQVFDPFFTTKAGSGSSGLGLATTHAIVEQAGGTVEIDSAVGRGTRVEVSLPVGEPRRSGPGPADGLADGTGGDESLLLVDDNEALAEAASTHLRALGYRVRVVADVEAALAAAREEPFDLVITDVQVRGRTGPELVEALREVRPVKALYMSGYTDRIALRSGRRPDEAFFLKKPFSAAGLARMTRTLLDAPDPDRASPA